jgi:hypothetical protein
VENYNALLLPFAKGSTEWLGVFDIDEYAYGNKTTETVAMVLRRAGPKVYQYITVCVQ